jgi:hypothetical protein
VPVQLLIDPVVGVERVLDVRRSDRPAVLGDAGGGITHLVVLARAVDEAFDLDLAAVEEHPDQRVEIVELGIGRDDRRRRARLPAAHCG